MWTFLFFTIVLHLNGSSAITLSRLPFTPPFNSLKSHQHWSLPTSVDQITIMVMTRKKPCRYRSIYHTIVSLFMALPRIGRLTICLKVGSALRVIRVYPVTSCSNFLRLLMREKWLLFGIILSVPIRDHDRNTSQVLPDPPPNWAQKDGKSEISIYIIMQGGSKSNGYLDSPFVFLHPKQF